MASNKRRRTYGLSREQKLLKRQRDLRKEAYDMPGIIDLEIGTSYDESVHERWDTGDPRDWHGCRDIHDVEHELRAVDDGTTPDDDVEHDAALIWDWILSYRAAREA